MKTVYQADDGTIFDIKTDCEEYESHYEEMSLTCQLEGLGDAIQFWDMSGKPITYFDPLSYSFDNAFFIYAKTQEAFDILADVAKATDDIPSPTDSFELPGLYWYDDDMREWRSFDLEMEALTNILKLLEIDWK